MLRTILLSVALSVAGLAAVLFWLGSPSDLAQLLRVPGWAVAAGLVLLAFSFAAGGLRLKLLAHLAGKRIRFLRATRAHVLGLFSAAVTPGGSGNAIAIALTLQRDRLEGPLAWSVTVYTTVLDLLFFAWTVPAGILVLSLYHLNFGGTLFSWAAPLLGVVFLGMWYVLAFRPHWLGHVAERVFAWRPLRRWQKPILEFLEQMASVTSLMTGSGLLAQVNLQILTALLHFAIYAIFFVIARSLGADLALLPTMSVILLVSVISYVVPTPGGSGYLEFALSYVFSRQVPAALVTPSVLAWRVVTFYLPLLIGPFLGGPMLARTLAGGNGDSAKHTSPE